jgi:hypothetical protein
VDLRIDDDYVPDMNQRLTVYRKIAAVRTEEELEQQLEELRDRYGPPPPSVLNLATYARIRVLADRLRVESIDREGHAVVFKFRPDAPVDLTRLLNVLKRRPDTQLIPPTVLKLDLKQPMVAPDLGRQRMTASPPAGRADALRRAGRLGQTAESKRGTSWWTKRAQETEVTPGFTKENLTRQAKEDPGAKGGLFDRITNLLIDLTD